MISIFDKSMIKKVLHNTPYLFENNSGFDMKLKKV